VKLKATKKTENALYVLKRLSSAHSPVDGGTLMKELKTSAALLSQSLKPIIKNGWIVSRPGPDGGYQLADNLKKLTDLQVVESIEGPMINAECVVSDRRCGIDPPCALHAVWGPTRVALRQSLNKQSAI
jgi:Rrf2 family protein